MSIRLMSAVWSVDLPDSEKLVLLALADCANDEGQCWPSMANLARKCSKSDRTIQAAIKELVSKGHLTRKETPGRGCRYIVHPRSDCTPERSSPPKGTTRTPEAVSDKPSRTLTPSGDKSPSGSARAGKPVPARPKGTFIDPDWKAPEVADLPLSVREQVGGWLAGEYERQAAMFVNHFVASSSPSARKRDWTRTWHNWLLRAEVKRSPNAPPPRKALSISEQITRLEEMASNYRKWGREDDAIEADRQVARLRQSEAIIA